MLRHFLRIFILGILLFVSPSIIQASDIKVITLDDKTINPVTAEYIIRSIDQAEQENTAFLVLELDTPGGLLNSTRSIVKRMMTAKIPIVVYISPKGGRAGSAGVFITYASHIAAMAPSTNIGAAHPVSIGSDRPISPENRDWQEMRDFIGDLRESSDSPLDSKKDEASSNEQEAYIQNEPDSNPMASKILNDTVAFIKAIATERGRNAQWAELSVSRSESITNDQALKKGVVEIVANDFDDLLNQLDGRTVVVQGRPITLNTQNERIVRIPMDARQNFFNIFADPNIAYFLLILGFYGLLFELTHPGIGVPGILGYIFLILALYSMQTLPTNYAGLALMGVGLILLVAEAYVPGFGLLTVGGMVSLAMGSMLLFESADPVMRVSRILIAIITVSFGGCTLFLIGFLLRNRTRQAMSGREGMQGLIGQVLVTISPERAGQVFVHGERWQAICDESCSKGTDVVVVSITGLTLKVKPIKL